LWGIDIVGGIELVNAVTGVGRDAKIVTGVDDHSRFCVMAAVVERATARAVCLAFAQALARYGVPEEVITDNGKQFTDRFSRYGARRGEMLFDKICRKNGGPGHQPGFPLVQAAVVAAQDQRAGADPAVHSTPGTSPRVNSRSRTPSSRRCSEVNRMVVPFGSALEWRSRTTYRPTVTPEGSTHVYIAVTGTTSSFSRAASGKLAR